VLVPLRIEQHGVRWFVHLGREFETSAHTSSKIGPQLGWQSEIGYDGQYYFGVAVDPVHAKDYMGDRAGYVYGRLGFPLVAGLLGGGSVDVVPYTMLAIELAAVLAATVAIALWLKRRGLPVWLALLYGLYPGLIFSVFHDLTEPLAFAFAAVGMLALQRRRVWLSAALLALAILTRETTFPFALAAAASLAFADRAWRRPVGYLAATFVPAIVWRAVVASFTGEQTAPSGIPAPLGGLTAWRFDQEHRLIVATVVVPAVLAAAGALLVLRVDPVAACLVLLNVALYVVFLQAPNYVDYGSAGRDAIPVVLSTIFCLRSERRALPLYAALALSSLPAFLAVAARLDLRGLDLITQ
jgi:hypothetical protein